MSTAARTLVTEQEFLSLPEGTERAELIDGEVVMAPSPGFWHQELLIRIVEALRMWARAHRNVTVAMAPLDVRFGPGKILQPDAMVFGSRLAIDGEGPIDEIPVLCIGVLSKNRAYDRITKRFLYAEAGVREYWIVEPSGTVERRAGEALTELEEVRTVLETPLLVGFSLDLGELFSRER